MDALEPLLFALGVAAFFAGFVDAVVGGGGLIQIPALFSAYPTTSAATLFGTNKLASMVGTSSAAIQYARRIPIIWEVAIPATIAALIGSWFGAKAVVFMPPDMIRPVILLLLVAVAIYTLAKKDFGTVQAQRLPVGRERLVALVVGMGIGFYDGFFGPGTGSFLIFLFVRYIRLDFLAAAAMAKIVNVATNLSAFMVFAGSVEIYWKLGLVMAVCNLTGAIFGSRMALRRGSAFIRRFFIAVVCVLIGKMAYDILHGFGPLWG